MLSRITLLVGPPGREEPAGEFVGSLPGGSLRDAVAAHTRRTWAEAFRPRRSWVVNVASQYRQDLGRAS